MLLISALLQTGCATLHEPSPSPWLLDFLQDGRTTREEIVLQLGMPSKTIENEQILFYRVGQNRKGYFVRDNYEQWADVRHSLVLVLDEQGVLQKHALVNVR